MLLIGLLCYLALFAPRRGVRVPAGKAAVLWPPARRDEPQLAAAGFDQEQTRAESAARGVLPAAHASAADLGVDSEPAGKLAPQASAGDRANGASEEPLLQPDGQDPVAQPPPAPALELASLAPRAGADRDDRTKPALSAPLPAAAVGDKAGGVDGGAAGGAERAARVAGANASSPADATVDAAAPAAALGQPTSVAMLGAPTSHAGLESDAQELLSTDATAGLAARSTVERSGGGAATQPAEVYDSSFGIISTEQEEATLLAAAKLRKKPRAAVAAATVVKILPKLEREQAADDANEELAERPHLLGDLDEAMQQRADDRVMRFGDAGAAGDGGGVLVDWNDARAQLPHLDARTEEALDFAAEHAAVDPAAVWSAGGAARTDEAGDAEHSRRARDPFY